MNGRERVCAALSAAGTPEIPAVIPYEGIYLRDHWAQLTARPWWALYSLRIDEQCAWRQDVAQAIGQDWFSLPLGASRQDRSAISLQQHNGRAYLIDGRTGAARQLSAPRVGGWPEGGVASFHPGQPPETPDQVDAWIEAPKSLDSVLADGRADLPAWILSSSGMGLERT